jgi:nitroreductase
MTLNLTPDELLSTTRSVRKRLDLERPVPQPLIEECLQLALQAPSGGNAQGWHFVVVTDPAKKLALGNLYRKAWEVYSRPFGLQSAKEARSTTGRVRSSAEYLAQHMHRAPVLVIPCVEGRADQVAKNASLRQASLYGSILPAAWSFMLAARSRGLGTCWTTLHLMYEPEAAAALGIPYERVTQAAMIPVAYTLGESFQPAPRKSLEEVMHLESW